MVDSQAVTATSRRNVRLVTCAAGGRVARTPQSGAKISFEVVGRGFSRGWGQGLNLPEVYGGRRLGLG